MEHANKQPLQPVEGEIIPDSLVKILGSALAALAMGLVGVVVVWAWWTDASFADRKISNGGGLFGAFLCLVGLLAPVAAFKAIRRTSLILGDICFQEVSGNSRVTLQIPYKNIARIEFLRKDQHTELQEDIIGIELHDVNDPVTLCAGSEKSKRQWGWHYRLTQMTRAMPLQKIFDRLRKRVA